MTEEQLDDAVTRITDAFTKADVLWSKYVTQKVRHDFGFDVPDPKTHERRRYYAAFRKAQKLLRTELIKAARNATT